MSADTWTIAEAKAKFSQVVDRSRSQGPQVITRHGRQTAVVVATEEWERKIKRVGTLADFFANSPLRGSGMKLERLKIRVRKLDR